MALNFICLSYGETLCAIQIIRALVRRSFKHYTTSVQLWMDIATRWQDAVAQKLNPSAVVSIQQMEEQSTIHVLHSLAIQSGWRQVVTVQDQHV